MRKKTLFLFVFLCSLGFRHTAFSQDVADWQSPHIEDSVRRLAFQGFIMENYIYTDTDSSLFYSRKFKKQAQNWEIPAEVALGWQMEGLSHFIGGDFDAAHFCLSNSLAQLITLGDRDGAIKLLSNLAMVAEHQGRLDDAIHYNLYAVDYFEEINDQANLIKCLMNLGGNYFELHDYESAADYYFKSYDHAVILKDSSRMASNLMNIALVQIEQKKTDDALINLKKSLQLKKSHSSPMLVSRCEENLGSLYTDLNELDSAKKYLFSSYQTKKEINDVRGIMKVEANLGGYYLKRGLLDSAKYFLLPLTQSEKSKDFLDIRITASDYLHQIYEQERQFDQSLFFYKLYRTLTDSLTMSEEKTEIMKIEYQFDLDKQHLKDSLRYQKAQYQQELTYESQLQKSNFWLTTLLLASTFMIILIVLIVIGYRQKQKSNIVISNQNKALNQEKRKTELNFLKNQISPHFFFNSLNTIYAFSQTDNKMAGEITHKLGKLMHYLVYDSDQSTNVTLGEEVAFLQYYIELSEIRMPKTVEVNFNINIQSPSLKIPPLLFVNLVENSFKHGVSNSEKCLLNFSISEVNGKVTFTATNTIPTNKNESKGGVGTTNLKRRLDLIYGKENYTFDLSNSQEIFKAVVSFNSIEGP